MLTILRKIRKTIIVSGSVRKYFLYAIGEIVLVVIGILIALQINNYNESRKSKREFKQYLLALSEDIKNDTNTIQSYINTLDYQAKASKFLIPILESEKSAVLDSLAFVKAFMSLSNASNVAFNTEIWEEIRTSGLHKKFASPQLIEGIQDYYKRYQRYATNWQNAYRNRIEWRELKYSFLSQQDLDIMRSDPPRVPSNDAFKAIKAEAQLLTLSKSIAYTSSLFLSNFKKCKGLAENCIVLMEKEIDSL